MNRADEYRLVALINDMVTIVATAVNPLPNDFAAWIAGAGNSGAAAVIMTER
jgi:hypothetical protein